MSVGKHVLIVRGGWDGHQPIAATDSFLPYLADQGYTVRIEDSSDAYADAEAMAKVDLIIQCNTMTTITGEAVRGLRSAVAAGTGMVGWHGGIADSYRDSSDYLQLIGGQFATHPPRTRPEDLEPEDPTLNFRTYTVNIVPEQREHPIVAGLSDFELTTEQYWILSDDYNDVLATTTLVPLDFEAWNRPITCPAVWTRSWGKGRIVVATPGHSFEVLNDSNVRTIIERGITWATR